MSASPATTSPSCATSTASSATRASIIIRGLTFTGQQGRCGWSAPAPHHLYPRGRRQPTRPRRQIPSPKSRTRPRQQRQRNQAARPPVSICPPFRQEASSPWPSNSALKTRPRPYAALGLGIIALLVVVNFIYSQFFSSPTPSAGRRGYATVLPLLVPPPPSTRLRHPAVRRPRPSPTRRSRCPAAPHSTPRSTPK